MGSLHKDEHGFGAVEVMLVLVIVALIGVVGFLVYKNHGKTNPAPVASTTAAKQTPTSQTKTATAPDPYAGWKSYCDSAGNCFKYPADWTPVTSGPAGAEPGNFRNPEQTLKLVSGADNSSGSLSDPAPWYTSKLAALSSTNDGYKVWGGYLAAEGVYIPQYAVVDASKVGSGGLAIGQIKSTTDDTYISYKAGSGKQPYRLDVFALSSNGFTKATADSWFDSSDAKTALLIVQSRYHQ